MLDSTKGQVWIETVIYTLIGLTIIGIVLSLVTPRINDFRDRTVIEQTIDSLEILDGKLQEVVDEGAGNVRIVEFAMRRGYLEIDATTETITYTLEDSRSVYSEDGVPIQVGRVSVLTQEGAQTNTITLTIDYSEYNILFEGVDENKRLNAASVPYRLRIRHDGFNSGVAQIDVGDVS